MLTIEILDAAEADAGKAQVEIFCDAEGLSLLSKKLDHLRAGATHVHLMTPAWAGNELGEKPFGPGSSLVHHLRITMIPENVE